MWAFIAWLTVTPNQDILVDGIQAQTLIQDPRIVLSFPGQKHGGPLEYPATILAEWLAPGNYFANAAIRPILAFVTGYLVARLFLRLFPQAPRWAFLVAVAVGPTIIHGQLGPESNAVGVWWLQPNWDMAWLLVTGGALLIAGVRDSQRGVARALLGGLLVGLGFWAHPAIVLLIVPLATLILLVARPPVRAIAWGLAGAIIGIIPAGISYIVNAGINTWDPSHGAFIAVDYYRGMGGAVLGLDGIPDFMFALLPYGIGLSPSQDVINGTVQSLLMWLFVVVIVLTSALSVIAAVRQRRWLSPRGAVAIAWLASMISMFVFITFVDPVWIYSSGLAILFWLSIGVLPALISPHTLGISITGVILAVVGLSTISHNWWYLSSLPDGFSSKVDTQEENKRIADALVANDVQVIYGSYYDVVPVGYASGLRLRTITTTYNRFPLTPSEAAFDSIRVAVNAEPTHPWGQEALDAVRADCTAASPVAATDPISYEIFDCPATVLSSSKR